MEMAGSQHTKSPPYSAASNRTKSIRKPWIRRMYAAMDPYSETSDRTESERKMKDASEGQHTKSAPYSAARNRADSDEKISEEVTTVIKELTDENENHFHRMCCQVEMTKKRLYEWKYSDCQYSKENEVMKMILKKTLRKSIRFTEAIDELHSVEERRRQHMSEAFQNTMLEVERMPEIFAKNKSEVEIAIERLRRVKESVDQKEAEKTRYDTSGKTGLLCFIQHKQPDWERGNQRDKKKLLEFFEDTLEFDVKEYSSYDVLDSNLERDYNLSSEQYYCLVICISGHGNEKGVETKSGTYRTDTGEIKRRTLQLKPIDDIKKRFSNKTIPTLAGVPKIILLDVCRGEKPNKTVSTDDLSMKLHVKGGENSVRVLPTTDSDICLILATTHGHVSAIPINGSVGIQGVMTALTANWKNDHLEEMLIDARGKVAQFNGTYKNEELRQTLETQSTLTHRLKFVKRENKKKQDVPPAESNYEKD